ncbi:MAG: hypothetical protein QOK40_2768 [Miltoncostaeaceae bacterium]|jgi:hypothetical protein|nr:hypothetical protein [Miltoncostaeaceae bacterium]
MRKVIFAVLAGAALPSVALAAPGGVPGAPASHPNGRHVGPPETSHFGQGGRHVGPAIDATTTEQTAPATTVGDESKKGKGKALGKWKVHRVAFVMRGTLSADAAADSFTMTVRGGNRHARRALAGVDSTSVKLDATTRIWKAGIGKASYSDLKSGDRVLVMWKAPRKSAAADLPAARFVMDIGPAPVAATPTTPEPPAQP